MMQDTPRVAFLVLMDVFVIAMLLIVLNGCSARPVRFQDHPHGDFVSHMAAAPDAARAPGVDQRRVG
jgi:hypothetical protein